MCNIENWAEYALKYLLNQIHAFLLMKEFISLYLRISPLRVFIMIRANSPDKNNKGIHNTRKFKNERSHILKALIEH